MTLDLTTFTEVDGEGDITVTAPKCDVSSMRRVAISFVYKDFEVGHFGDVAKHDFEAEIASSDSSGLAIMYTLTDSFGTFADLTDGFSAYITDVGGVLRFSLWNHTTSGQALVLNSLSTSTRYYLRLTRSTTTVTLFVYSDAARTSLLGSNSFTADGDTKRYLQVCASRDASGASAITYFSQNYELFEIGPKAAYYNRMRAS